MPDSDVEPCCNRVRLGPRKPFTGAASRRATALRMLALALLLACVAPSASEAGTDPCLTCHTRIAPHARWKGSAHERAGLTCSGCHSDHGPSPQSGAGTKFLRAGSEAETCYGCHAEIRHAVTQRSTHLFRDGQQRQRMSCATCHEPHGGGAKSGNDVCYTCHDDKRGPFLWEHAPVRESCANCHTPHGSNNRFLLTVRPPLLCQSCHAGDAHVSDAGAVGGPLEINRSCVNCHQLVHGSNHPSGITLQR